jgi:O-antigen ligase/predicted negative regulator of RcsB-dependent stress response
MQPKTLKTITKILLLSVVAVLPFVKTMSLYFPFISGKVYLFRLFVSLAFFFWLWTIVKAQSEKLKAQNYYLDFRNILVVALALFFLAQVFVSFFSVDPFYSFFSSIDRQDGVLQYGFWLLYFLMLTAVFKEERDWKIFFSVFLFVAFLLSAYSFLSSEGKLEGKQFYALFGNPAYFAAFLLFAIGFSFITFERKFFRSKIANNLLLALAFFLTLTLIFTQIRGAYVGFFAGVFLFCLLSLLFFRQENKKLAFACGIVLLAGVILIGTVFAARHTAFVKKSEILSRVTEVIEIWQVPSVRERLLNWNIALKGFLEKPVFGWGPENYGVVANKYYDFRIGENEPWFDRAHNQPLDILVTGGIVLFFAYLALLFAVFLLIWKIAKQYKILSFILASTFLAYWVQGLFLFDTLAVYLGLFPFFAYLIFLGKKENVNFNQRINQRFISGYLLFFAAVISLFLIYTTVFIPWRANHLAKYFFDFTHQGYYKETKPYLEKAFAIYSPYTYWELRKMTAFQLKEVLEDKVSKETEPAKIKELQQLYDFIVPELEKYINARPSYPLMYHFLAEIYRLGFEKLGKNDLAKAELVLKKALNYSDLRMEYFNDLAKVLLLEGKFEEAEKLVKLHTERMPPQWGKHLPFITLGNFYFEAGKYNLALEQYDKARETGFQIHKHFAVYPRYMLSAEKVKDYIRIVEMGQKYLEYIGPDADTYFNIAVGYFHLGEKEKAKEFFLKAVELKREYEQYKEFFVK